MILLFAAMVISTLRPELDNSTMPEGDKHCGAEVDFFGCFVSAFGDGCR
jgi:hypothetical protein